MPKARERTRRKQIAFFHGLHHLKKPVGKGSQVRIRLGCTGRVGKYRAALSLGRNGLRRARQIDEDQDTSGPFGLVVGGGTSWNRKKAMTGVPVCR